MRTRLRIIERGKFIEGAVFAVLLVLLFNWYFESDEPIFRISLKGFTSEVNELEVSFSESKLLIIEPVFESVGTSDKVVTFVVPKSEGHFDLIVRTDDGKIYELIDIPYRASEFSYISKIKDDINFVKGHWE